MSQDTKTNTTSLQFLFNPLSIENNKVVPKVGDLWLLVATMSSHHQVKFFFPQIDVLFVVKDKVVKVEHFGVESKVLCGDWGKKMMENGYGILSMKRGCIMKDINFQWGLTL